MNPSREALFGLSIDSLFAPGACGMAPMASTAAVLTAQAMLERGVS